MDWASGLGGPRAPASAGPVTQVPSPSASHLWQKACLTGATVRGLSLGVGVGGYSSRFPPQEGLPNTSSWLLWEPAKTMQSHSEQVYSGSKFSVTSQCANDTIASQVNLGSLRTDSLRIASLIDQEGVEYLLLQGT